MRITPLMIVDSLVIKEEDDSISSVFQGMGMAREASPVSLSAYFQQSGKRYCRGAGAQDYDGKWSLRAQYQDEISRITEMLQARVRVLW